MSGSRINVFVVLLDLAVIPYVITRRREAVDHRMRGMELKQEVA